MPPMDTKRRGPFRAYACGKHCSLNIGGRCCRAMLVDMDQVGARLQVFDARSLEMVTGCQALRMDIDNVRDRRLGKSLKCSVGYQEGATVVVHFDIPLKMGMLELQQELGLVA